MSEKLVMFSSRLPKSLKERLDERKNETGISIVRMLTDALNLYFAKVDKE